MSNIETSDVGYCQCSRCVQARARLIELRRRGEDEAVERAHRRAKGLDPDRRLPWRRYLDVLATELMIAGVSA